MRASPKAASLAPVRVSASTMKLARAEAALAGRTLSGQVDYWARLGRAVEHSPAFNHVRVRAALAGKLDADTLNDAESEAYFAGLGEAMETQPTASGQAFWDRLRAEGGGVGLDETGRLVRGHADGSVEVLKPSA